MTSDVVNKIEDFLIKNLNIKLCLKRFPNLIEMLSLGKLEIRMAWPILGLICLLFFVKMNRLEPIQRAGILFVGLTIVMLHMQALFCLEGYKTLTFAMIAAGAATFVSVKKSFLDPLLYVVGFYCVTLCIFVYTLHLDVYSICTCLVAALMVYLAISEYLGKILQYLFLRAVLNTIIIAAMTETTILSYIFTLEENNIPFLGYISVEMTRFILIIITVLNVVIISVNEIRGL